MRMSVSRCCCNSTPTPPGICFNGTLHDLALPDALLDNQPRTRILEGTYFIWLQWITPFPTSDLLARIYDDSTLLWEGEIDIDSIGCQYYITADGIDFQFSDGTCATECNSEAEPLTLTLDGDTGSVSASLRHDSGMGGSYYTHCNDDPESSSTDYVENNDTSTGGDLHFTLSNVPADFDEMLRCGIVVDVWSETAVTDDELTITARIYDAVGGNALTDESIAFATEEDTTRITRNIEFSNLTGTKTQWNSAVINLTWTYTATGGGDNANLRLYGCEVTGLYLKT